VSAVVWLATHSSVYYTTCTEAMLAMSVVRESPSVLRTPRQLAAAQAPTGGRAPLSALPSQSSHLLLLRSCDILRGCQDPEPRPDPLPVLPLNRCGSMNRTSCSLLSWCTL